jgi:hypothetical protein
VLETLEPSPADDNCLVASSNHCQFEAARLVIQRIVIQNFSSHSRRKTSKKSTAIVVVIMATIMSQMVSIKVGGLPAVQNSLTRRKLGDARLAPKLMTSATRGVRCESGGGRGPLADVQRAVDESTKQVITKDEILRNQEVNESEKRSVFGAKPNSGSFYPRPELERRPETGSKSFWSVFAFDGAAPETINCRLVPNSRSLLEHIFFLLPRVQISGS